MKKNISFLMFFIAFVSLIFIGVSTKVYAIEDSSYFTVNKEINSIQNIQMNVNDFSGKRPTSLLYDNGDNTLTKIDKYNSGKNGEEYVVIQKLNSNFNQIGNDVRINTELSKIGTVFCGKDNNYMVFGQDNTDKSDDAEVIRIVKYDKNWKRLNQCSVKGINTTKPFNYGTCDVTEYGDYLVVYTSHEMYNGHQANLMIQIKKSNMSCAYTKHIVWNTSTGYVSHAYNQFVKTDDSYLYAADLGDAYPRGIFMAKYNQSSLEKPITKATVFNVTGNTGDNYTGVKIGGFEVSNTHCLAVANSVRQLESGKNTNEKRNIVLVVANKNDLTQSKQIWLTNYEYNGTVEVGLPYITKINNNKFAVTWELRNNKNSGTIQMVLVDGQGNLLTDVISFGGLASNCSPILFNNKVTWYVYTSIIERTVFFHVDSEKLKNYSNKNLVNEKNYPHFDISRGTTGGFSLSNYDDSLETLTIPYCDYPWFSMRLGCKLFTNCTKLKNVIIPGDFKFTGINKQTGIYSPFQQNKIIESVTFLNGVTNINDRYFYMCSNLKKLVLPNAVEKIGEYAFYNCVALEENVVIPKSVQNVGKWAFYPDKKITGIKFENSETQIGERIASFSANVETEKTIYPVEGLKFSKVTPNDSTIVSTDINGKITGVKAGTTIVKYYIEGITNPVFQVEVTVTQREIPIEQIFLIYEEEEIEGQGISERGLFANVYPYSTTMDKTVTFSSSNNNIASIDKNGKITVHKSGTVTFKATAVNGIWENREISFNYTDIDLPFSDTDSKRWYINYIKYVYDKGLMAGYQDEAHKGMFGPNDTMTRAQLVVILYRNAGKPSAGNYKINFKDIPDTYSSYFYYDAVKWAAKNGIVTGYEGGKYDGQFRPNDPITREQLAVILQRYAGYQKKNNTATSEINGFADSNQVSNYAKNGVKWAVAVGILKGNDLTNALNPKQTATRAEAAAMLQRYIENVK